MSWVPLDMSCGPLIILKITLEVITNWKNVLKRAASLILINISPLNISFKYLLKIASVRKNGRAVLDVAGMARTTIESRAMIDNISKSGR